MRPWEKGSLSVEWSHARGGEVTWIVFIFMQCSIMTVQESSSY